MIDFTKTANRMGITVDELKDFFNNHPQTSVNLHTHNCVIRQTWNEYLKTTQTST